MNTRTVWIGAGAMLTVVAMLLGMASVWGIVRSVSTETERQTETYPRPATGVEIDIPTGDVSITGHDADRVDVVREIAWSQAKPTFDETWSGDTFRVDGDCPNGFPPWIGGSCEVDYAARIPDAASLDVETTTSRIDLDGLAGDTRVWSTTGDVTGTDLRSNQVAVALTTGDIDLRFAEPPGDVSIESITGDIVLEVPRGGEYAVDIETTTGDEQVDVVQDPAAARAITVRATTSDVWIRYAR